MNVPNNMSVDVDQRSVIMDADRLMVKKDIGDDCLTNQSQWFCYFFSRDIKGGQILQDQTESQMLESVQMTNAIRIIPRASRSLKPA